MNFLFGLAQGLFSALFVFVAWWVISRKLKMATIPRKHRKYEKPVVGTVAALLAIIVIWNAAGTYGPRITLEKTASPSVPEVVAIDGGAEMTTRKIDERVGQFDEKIKEKP